jgi:hypothetical protein
MPGGRVGRREGRAGEQAGRRAGGRNFEMGMPRAMASRAAAAAWIGGRRPEPGRSAARAKASRHMEGGSSRDGSDSSDSSDSTGDGGLAGAIARRDVIGRCHRRVRRRAIAGPGLGALRCVQERAEHRPRRMVTTRNRLPTTTAACRRQQADKTRWVGWRLSCLKPRHDVLAPAACARALGCFTA